MELAEHGEGTKCERTATSLFIIQQNNGAKERWEFQVSMGE